ncbi:MAG: amidohydrolase family protein [Bacteroidota bacterium]
MKTRIYLLAICAAALTTLALTLKEEKKKWDVSNPPGKYTETEFTVSEGTFMNLDVSPDGKEIVFDLLGDIYIMPVTGGEAKVLRSGLPFEVQPRFSPDGKKISFTSDAGGGDNIWMMDRDGSNAKQVTRENFRLLNNAVWMPNGNYLVARKHFTSTRSLGAGELWMYHFTGGEGIQLTKRKNDQQDLGEPSVSPDGKYVYYSEDMYPGGFFQYNKNPNSQIYVIKRYDVENGETEIVAGGPGGAVRPQISRDGKTLAFVRRVHTKSVLFLRNMETGEEWPVYDKLGKDQQEAWAIFGVYANFAWLDAKNIIIWAEGKIRKVDVTANTGTDIPFTAKCKHRMRETLKFAQEVAPDQFTVKTIRQVVTSPDEKTIVFNAVGYLWKKSMGQPSNAPAPVRLTKGSDLEFEPCFSPKGNEIVCATWNDEQMGTVSKVSLASGQITKLTQEKGIFRTPRYSPDGSKIVFQKEDGNEAQGNAFCVNPGIYWIPASGGKMTLITKEGSEPYFSADGKRIFFQSNEGKDNALKSCDLSGNDVKVHFTSKYTNMFVPSPDNKWIAYKELFKVYIAAFPEAGKSIDLSADIKSVPGTQVARDAGLSLHWSADSKKLHWVLGDEYFTNDLTRRFTFLPGAMDTVPPLDTAGTRINLVLKTDKPKQVLALKNARIITMNAANEVIESGTIIITDNRITEIGKTGEVKIPTGAKEIDYAGKTIMPGLVDVHAHLGTFRQGLSPQKQWQYYANLAYGVTTTHDPSSNTEMVFSQSEMVKAGNMVGPRVYSTGWILYGADGDFKAVINSLEDAKSAIRRTKAYGAFSVKSYNQPRREQRQQVIEAASQLGIMVVPEGGSTSWYNLSHVADGHTGVEHNLPYAPLYDDVVKFWSASKTGYTPTLIVCYGTVSGEYYWYQKTNVWEKKRLLSFTPRGIVDARSRHRTMIPDEEYENGHILVSKSCKKLLDAGVKVNMGSHGQLQGLGAHWELWMLRQGGMTNMEALRCATMNGAWYIGMDKDIGSLEKGKLADLIVLEKNPLDDIYNTETVQFTMVNGRLYDCETMNEVGSFDKKRTKFWWEGKYSANFNFHEESHGDED